jgi:hypothetical protein
VSLSFEQALDALRSRDSLVRAQALDVLQKGARGDEREVQVVERLLECLADPATPARSELIEFAFDLVSASSSCASAFVARSARLAPLFDSPDEVLRASLIPLAVRLSEAKDQFEPALKRHALEDDAQRVRLGCVFALATLGADVAAVAQGMFSTETDPLDRLVAALALMTAHPQLVDLAMAELALSLVKTRAVLLRCGDVPLIDNPRATLADALAKHPARSVRARVLTVLLETAGDENWIDDGTAAGLLRLGDACDPALKTRALHLVATRAFGPTGGLDLIAVLTRAGLPSEPKALQKLLGPRFPIGQWALPEQPRAWWQFWRRD